MRRSLAGLSTRQLKMADLSAALAIQAESYPPFLLEGEEAFASRVGVSSSYCLAAVRGDALVGYLLAHGWTSRAPPPIGTILLSTDVPEILFIHDLAVAREEQGSGVGRVLVAKAFEQARAQGLTEAELIAVEGSADYWRALGFSEATVSAELNAKVAAYGADTRLMTSTISSAVT